jgi:hypothetical protein
MENSDPAAAKAMCHGVGPSRALRAAAVALLALACAQCGSRVGPSEAGLSVPKDPGRVVVRVHDQVGIAVEKARVCVEMPNDIGSFFKQCSGTRVDGMTVFSAVPAGRRPVDVTPPAGFVAGVGGLIQEVNVTKGSESRVEFELRRN